MPYGSGILVYERWLWWWGDSCWKTNDEIVDIPAGVADNNDSSKIPTAPVKFKI
jgi:hypothetical protein